MTRNDAKLILNEIIGRHPQEVAQLFQDYGEGGVPITPKNLMIFYDKHGDEVGDRLYEIYSSYNGEISDYEVELIGFNGEENEVQERSKFRQLLDSVKTFFVARKTVKEAGEITEDEDEKGTRILGMPVPMFIGFIVIALLILWLVFGKKK